MRNLRELTIEVLGPGDIGDPKHCEITIEPAVDSGNYADFFPPGTSEPDMDEELRAAGRFHAGVLARVYVALSPWIDYERQLHGCARGGPDLYDEKGPPRWGDACYLSHGGLVEPGMEECYLPRLYILVDAAKRKQWVARVAAALDDIRAKRTWMPIDTTPAS